jgi:hypothetical protein
VGKELVVLSTTHLVVCQHLIEQSCTRMKGQKMRVVQEVVGEMEKEKAKEMQVQE